MQNKTITFLLFITLVISIIATSQAHLLKMNIELLNNQVELLLTKTDNQNRELENLKKEIELDKSEIRVKRYVSNSEKINTTEHLLKGYAETWLGTSKAATRVVTWRGKNIEYLARFSNEKTNLLLIRANTQDQRWCIYRFVKNRNIEIESSLYTGFVIRETQRTETEWAERIEQLHELFTKELKANNL